MSDNAFAPASLTLAALRARGEPSFFERDTDVLKTLLVAWFEAESGRVLYPDQTEMFLIEMLAYALSLQNESAQAAILQNTVVWAQDGHLDDVAAGVSIARLPAQPARTRLRFTLSSSLGRLVTIPKGTLAGIDGAVFVTTVEATIAAGQLAAEVDALATVAGTAANGFAAGQIRASLASIAPGLTAANITVSTGGTNRESDEQLRTVTVDAAEAFDRRGGWGGYGLAVRRVSPAIVEVAVDRPQAGHIHVVPMIAGDAPASAALLDQVRAALDPESVTPQGDFVTVRAPTPFDVAPTLRLKIDAGTAVAALVAAVDAGVRAAFAAMRRPLLSGSRRTQFAPETGRLGAQIAPARLLAAAMAVPGVVDGTIEGVAFTDLAFDRYPRLTSLTIVTAEAPDV